MKMDVPKPQTDPAVKAEQARSAEERRTSIQENLAVRTAQLMRAFGTSARRPSISAGR